MIRALLSSPAGRLSVRRTLFAVSVIASLGCAIASVVLDRNIQPGTVSVLATALASTAAAAGLGRFAESSEATP
jgi:MFS-type transporter involved in bile tolerance (Atg22 family)